MKLDKYAIRNPECQARQITREMFLHPDCLDGVLEYRYRQEGWSVVAPNGSQGTEGDYIVLQDGHYVIADKVDFERKWRIVNPITDSNINNFKAALKRK